MKGCWILLSLSLGAQTQLFETIRYQPPPNYNGKRVGGHIEFSRIDNDRKFYCQIAVFSPNNSLGSPQQDLDADWQALTAKTFKLRGTPTTRDLKLAQAPRSLLRASEGTDANGKTVITSLFLLWFGPQYVTVSFNTPRSEAFEACQMEVNTFVASISLVAAPPGVKPTSKAIGGPSPVPGAGTPSTTLGTIVGSWQRIEASTYNPATASNQFRNTRTYRFDASNQYTADFLFEHFSSQKTTRVLETGRYTVSNGQIQFQPASYSEGIAPRGQNPALTQKATPAAYARRFSIGDHPQFHDSVGLQMTESDGAVVTFKALR